MEEYVTKENVLAQLERCARDPYHETHYLRDAVINTIRRTEAADVVEVVRCEDCKFGELFQNDSSGVMARYCKVFTLKRMVADDDFCSYGERKDDDRTDF